MIRYKFSDNGINYYGINYSGLIDVVNSVDHRTINLEWYVSESILEYCSGIRDNYKRDIVYKSITGRINLLGYPVTVVRTPNVMMFGDLSRPDTDCLISVELIKED